MGLGYFVGPAENRANSAPIELGLGLSLALQILFAPESLVENIQTINIPLVNSEKIPRISQILRAKLFCKILDFY